MRPYLLTSLALLTAFSPSAFAGPTHPELVQAVQEGRLDEVAAASSSEIQEARDPSRRSLLHVAVFQADLFKDNPAKSKVYYDLIETLIARGADVDAVDGNGDTPLHEAAKYCQTESVLRLRRGWANVALRDSKGRTAADIAQAQVDAFKSQLKGRTGAELAYVEGKMKVCAKTVEYLKAPQVDAAGGKTTPGASTKPGIAPNGPVPSNPRSSTNAGSQAQ